MLDRGEARQVGADLGDDSQRGGDVHAIDLIDAGAHAHVLHRTEHLSVSLAGNNSAQDLLAALADDVGQDVGEPTFPSGGPAFGDSLKSNSWWANESSCWCVHQEHSTGTRS